MLAVDVADSRGGARATTATAKAHTPTPPPWRKATRMATFRPAIMTNSGRERRRAPRAIADFPIQLTPGNGATPARLKDLSTIGLCCTSTREIAEFTKLGIDLQLPGHSRRHTIQGAVVRCDAARGQKDAFEIAVYFTEIEPTTKQAIDDYVATSAQA